MNCEELLSMWLWQFEKLVCQNNADSRKRLLAVWVNGAILVKLWRSKMQLISIVETAIIGGVIVHWIFRMPSIEVSIKPHINNIAIFEETFVWNIQFCCRITTTKYWNRNAKSSLFIQLYEASLHHSLKESVVKYSCERSGEKTSSGVEKSWMTKLMR